MVNIHLIWYINQFNRTNMRSNKSLYLGKARIMPALGLLAMGLLYGRAPDQHPVTKSPADCRESPRGPGKALWLPGLGPLPIRWLSPLCPGPWP